MHRIVVTVLCRLRPPSPEGEFALPKGPCRTKNSTESNFATVRQIAMAISKRYGVCSEVLVFLGERGRKTVRIVKNNGGS